MTEPELDAQIEKYDEMIKALLASVDKEHLDIAEKCSFTDVCGALLLKADNSNIKLYIDEFSLFHEKYGADVAFNRLARQTFDIACEKLGHRYAVMAILIAFDDIKTIKDVLEKVYQHRIEIDKLLEDEE